MVRRRKNHTISALRCFMQVCTDAALLFSENIPIVNGLSNRPVISLFDKNNVYITLRSEDTK